MLITGVLLWALAGLSAGLMIGLAGAGGGIVAIPCFIYFGGMSFRDAAGYSLIIVSFGALFSWLAQRKDTRFRISLIIVAFSLATSYVINHFKGDIPPLIDILVLWSVCLYGLYRIWTLPTSKVEARTTDEPYTTREYCLAAICGVTLGGLVSLIGVGGGLVTVPFLLVFMRLSVKEAVATDVFCILMVAPFSAWIQGRFDVPLENLAGLAAGVIVAATTFHLIRKRLPERTLNVSRKGCLTLAICLALLASVFRNPFMLEIEKEGLEDIRAEAPVISTTL